MRSSRRLLTALVLLVPLISFAAVTVTVNGTNHTIPQTNEKGWGTNVTTWIQAISANTLQPTGGSFTLTADTDFGPNFGLKSIYLKSRATNPATSGVLRLGNTEAIGWRNAANGGNLLLTVDSSDQLTFNGVVLASSTGPLFQDSLLTIFDNADTTKKLQFQLSGITTGTTRTLTVPDASGTLLISGSVVDADISGSAAIADTKLATISTAGKVSNSATTATSANTASAIVARDGSGNFTAGTITANLVGNVTGNATNVTGTVAVANGGTGVTSSTGTGSVVLSNSPTLVTPALGTPSAAVLTNATGLPLTTGVTGVLATANGGTGQNSTATFPTSGVVTTNAGTQTLTNKDIDGGTASNTSRITLPKASLSTLTGLTRKEGTIVYATDQAKAYIDNGSSLLAVGSGTGSDSANLLTNGGFEDTTYSTAWTASGGVSAVGTSTNIGVGLQSYTWDSSASSQTLTSTAVTIPAGYYSTTGEVSCRIRTPSGTATHTIQAYDGSNILASTTILSSSTFTQTSLNFVFPTSGSISLRLVSVASNEPLIAIDDCYVGPARNVGTDAVITSWETASVTSSLTTNATTTAIKRRVGDTAEYIVQTVFSGANTQGAYQLTLDNTIDTAKIVATSAGVQQLGDSMFFDSSSGTGTGRVIGHVRYASTTTVNVDTLPITGATDNMLTNINSSTNVPVTFATGDRIVTRFSVPVVGWRAETTYRPDVSSWYVNANITGANPSLGTSNQASYVEITDAGLTLTPVTGSAAVGTVCSSTNAATTPSTSATTCAAGSEGIGASFTVPVAGMYEVCGYFTHNVAGTSANDAFATFQWVETATNAQSILQEGGTRIMSGTRFGASAGASGSYTAPLSNCGLFNFSTAGTKAVRLMYEQTVSSAPTTNALLADASASLGQRDIRITVRPWLGQVPAPLLVGSVTSNARGLERIERATISISGASTCSVTKQSGSWISSVGASSSVCTLTLASGIFSDLPSCVASRDTTGAAVIATSVVSSATSVGLALWTTAGAAATGSVHVICMGAR